MLALPGAIFAAGEGDVPATLESPEAVASSPTWSPAAVSAASSGASGTSTSGTSATSSALGALSSLASFVSVRPSEAKPRTAGSAASVASACPVRDPEDGKCYPSADAADIAWIARASSGAARNVRVRRLPSRQPVDVVDSVAVVLGPEPDLPLEADPDDDSEEDGPLAIVDGLRPGLSGAFSRSEPGVVLDTPEKRSFWRNIARSIRGLLVVRKDNGAPVSLPEEEIAHLFEMGFPLPIEQFPVERMHDTFLASRGKHRRHHALDLPAPRGTPIVAVVDGTVERLGRDRRGGIVCYQRDDTGKLVFYYAHMARHAPGLRVGDRVAKGQKIGEVGATGRATGPHLHFAVFRVDGETTPTKGLAVNPYVIFSTFVPR